MGFDPTGAAQEIEFKEWQFYRSQYRRRICALLLVLFGLLILVAIAIGFDWRVGDSLFSPANRNLGPPPTDVPYVSYSIPSQSGTNVACWYAQADKSKATVIMIHGIRGSRIDMLDRAKFLFDAGYSVLLIDLQAHGESIGEQITFGYLEKFDVSAAVADIKQKNPNERIVILGSSLGASAALLAWPLDVDAIILESVCPTVKKSIANRIDLRFDSIGKYLAPTITWQFQSRVGVPMSQVSAITNLRTVTCPKLILAGHADELATVQDAQQMFRAAPEPKQMEVIPKATHFDMFESDPDLYQQLVLDFLKTNVRYRSKETRDSNPTGQAVK